MALTNRWAVLTLCCLARVAMGLQFQSLPLLAPLLMADFGINYAELGFLIGLFFLPGALLTLLGGVVGARLGDKAIVVAGLGLSTLGAVLLAESRSFAGAFGSRVVTGGGGALLNLQLTKLVTDWFVGKEIATAMGVLLTMWPLGLALALATLGGLAAATSWQTAVYVTAAYPALALVLFVVLYRGEAPRPPTASGPIGASRARLWRLSARELGLVVPPALAWNVLNAALVVFVSFTPTLLIQRGHSLAAAGVLVSWTSWVSMGSVPLGGYLIDRTRRATLLIVVSAVTAAAATAALSVGGPPLAWIVLFGLALAPAAGVMALPGEVLRPESRSTGFGVFYTIHYVGMVLLPPVAGRLLDLTGTAAAALWFASLLSLLVVPLLGVFRALQRRWVPVPP